VKAAPLVALVLLSLIPSCLPRPDNAPLVAAPAGPLLRALEERRQSFPGFKTLAGIAVSDHGRKRSFDTAGIAVDKQCRFRVEAYGPMGESLMVVLWNGRDMLIRPAEEAGRQSLERLLGEGLDAAELCAALSGGIPPVSEVSIVTLACGRNDACLLELRQGELLRKVGVRNAAADGGRAPVIISSALYRSGKLLYQARFDQVEETTRYRIPMRIELDNPDRKLRLVVSYSEMELDVPLGDEVFHLEE
jgi:hypothetical protein